MISKMFNRSSVDPLKWMRYFLIVNISLIILLPLMYSLSMVFKDSSVIFQENVNLIPKDPTFDPIMTVFAEYGVNLFNSLLIALGVTILTLSISIPGAYAFARKDFAGKNILFYMIIFVMLVPGVINVVPILVIWRNLGLYDSILGIWLAVTGGAIAIAVWVLRDNFQKLPPSIEEAARVYGCTQFSAFIRVVLPLAKPAIIAVSFLTFLQGWTEFLYSNILTTSGGPRPAVVALYYLLGGSADSTIPWPDVMATAFIISIPPIVLYAIERQYLEDALDF